MDNPVYRLLLKLAFAVAIFLWAAGYFSSTSQVYNVSLAEAHDTLARTRLPPVVFGTEAGAPEFTSVLPTQMKVVLLPPPDEDTAERNFTIDAADPARIVWTLERDGNPVFNLVATLTPARNHSTRVAVDMTPASDDPGGQAARRLAANKTIKNLYVTAMREQIAAVLEHRDYNLTSIYPAMMAATAANFAQLNANMRGAIEADHKRIEDNIAKAYEREAEGTGP